MSFGSVVIRRYLSNQTNRIGQVFIQANIQKLLTDITRFDEEKLFSRRIVDKLRSPKLMFMTDEQLIKAKEEAFENVKAKTQMPPVMEPDTSQPKVISKDEELVGYTKYKVMFVDISPGYTSRSRLMSVREKDGTLRYPTYEERTRLNHIYYPGEHSSIDVPKLFEEKHLMKALKNKNYIFVLDRACVQFEPDDPRYCEITATVYKYIDSKGHYDLLRSTRHFGPMSLYLAHNKLADNLILEMLSKKLVEDAAKLVRVYNACHNVEVVNEDGNEPDDLFVLRHYAENHSIKKYNLDLSLQELESKK